MEECEKVKMRKKLKRVRVKKKMRTLRLLFVVPDWKKLKRKGSVNRGCVEKERNVDVDHLMLRTWYAPTFSPTDS